MTTEHFDVIGYVNPEGKKVYRATCSHCGYVVTRSSRDSATHNMAQHVAYTHEGVPA